MASKAFIVLDVLLLRNPACRGSKNFHPLSLGGQVMSALEYRNVLRGFGSNKESTKQQQ